MLQNLLMSVIVFSLIYVTYRLIKIFISKNGEIEELENINKSLIENHGYKIYKIKK